MIIYDKDEKPYLLFYNILNKLGVKYDITISNGQHGGGINTPYEIYYRVIQGLFEPKIKYNVSTPQMQNTAVKQDNQKTYLDTVKQFFSTPVSPSPIPQKNENDVVSVNSDPPDVVSVKSIDNEENKNIIKTIKITVENPVPAVMTTYNDFLQERYWIERAIKMKKRITGRTIIKSNNKVVLFGKLEDEENTPLIRKEEREYYTKDFLKKIEHTELYKLIMYDEA